MSRVWAALERLQTNMVVDVMSSVLPEDALGEIPVGFAIVGHVGTCRSAKL